MALKKISEHFLVPKHELVPEDKVEEVLKKFGADKTRLPRLLVSDPMAEEIAEKKGDIVKITRNSPTAGKTFYFRVVV